MAHMTRFGSIATLNDTQGNVALYYSVCLVGFFLINVGKVKAGYLWCIDSPAWQQNES
jgi:hypothetical protein